MGRADGRRGADHWKWCGGADLCAWIQSQTEAALLPQPTFAEYEQALLAAGCEVFYYPLSEENGFRLTEDFLQVLTGEIDMVFLCNPNNPTGVLTERDLLIQILNRCKEKQIFFSCR